MKLLPLKFSGFTKDLPETGGTSTWREINLSCPQDTSHKISGSTHIVCCYDCGLYWNRSEMENEAT